MSLKNRRFDLKNAPRKRRSQSYPYWQAYNYWLNNSFLQKQCCFAVFLAFFPACSWRSDHEQGAGKIEHFFPSCSFWVHRVRSNSLPTTWTPGAGYILFPLLIIRASPVQRKFWNKLDWINLVDYWFNLKSIWSTTYTPHALYHHWMGFFSQTVLLWYIQNFPLRLRIAVSLKQGQPFQQWLRLLCL